MVLAVLLWAVPSVGQPAPPSKPAERAVDDWSARAERFGPLEWITRPARDVVMSFTIPVEIKDVPARPGQRVKAGELLVRARDGDAVAAVETQRVRVANTGPVDSAKAAVESAEVRYARILDADKDKATNQQEVDDRRVQLAAARAQLVNAENEQREEVARLNQLLESAARYRLEAPFDGVVESIVVEVGSSIEPPNPVLRLVDTDSLWIDLPTPTDLTLSKGLKQGDAAWVLLDVPGGFQGVGRVLYISPVADAAAATRRVRVELPNPHGLPPGTRARVSFEAPAGFVPTVPPTPEQAAGAPRNGRRGVVSLAGVSGPFAHDVAACVQCAKTAWEALERGEDPSAALARLAPGHSGKGAGK